MKQNPLFYYSALASLVLTGCFGIHTAAHSYSDNYTTLTNLLEQQRKTLNNYADKLAIAPHNTKDDNAEMPRDALTHITTSAWFTLGFADAIGDAFPSLTHPQAIDIAAQTIWHMGVANEYDGFELGRSPASIEMDFHNNDIGIQLAKTIALRWPDYHAANPEESLASYVVMQSWLAVQENPDIQLVPNDETFPDYRTFLTDILLYPEESQQTTQEIGALIFLSILCAAAGRHAIQDSEITALYQRMRTQQFSYWPEEMAGLKAIARFAEVQQHTISQENLNLQTPDTMITSGLQSSTIVEKI